MLSLALRALLLLAVVGVASVHAAARVHAASDKRLVAGRTDAPPVIDGLLDDPAWRAATFVSDFAQKQPVEGGPPSRETEVAIIYDQHALYVAARMHARGAADVQAVMTRDDDTGTAERIILSFDPFLDRRTAYSFAVTAAGVRADWFHPDDSEFSRDHSFDPVWQAEVAMNHGSWTAEMRIPFSQLRFPERASHTWGLNINRFIPQRNEDIFWIPVPKDANGWSSYFGELTGIRDVAPSRRIELLPYVGGDAQLSARSLVAAPDGGAPTLNDRLDLDVRAGLDAKMGLTPSLTLDATVNPDFGQIEADPAVVNLSEFETIQAERRPFFVEGSQLLAGRGPTYFYSRRIGAPARGGGAQPYLDTPTFTPILAATKLTGRLPSRLSVGALAAVTRPVSAQPMTGGTEPAEPVEPVEIEPWSLYSVTRVERELGKHASTVGASLTFTGRAAGDGPAADNLARTATTGGVDWNLRFADATYEVNGHAGFSAITGSEDAIAALQTSSAHYFQRPDQDHVRLDADREHLAGFSTFVGGGKRSGAWRWDVGVGAESPGFDLNDAGQLFAADDLMALGGVSYRDTRPGSLLHSWQTELRAEQEWNFGGVRAPGGAGLSGSLTFANFWTLSADSWAELPGDNDTITRGGPRLAMGWGGNVGASLSNSFASRTRWSAGGRLYGHQTGVEGIALHAELSTSPVDRLRLSLAPRHLRVRDSRQYVTTVDDPAAVTFGQRILFATVSRRELAAQVRASVAFTPDLALELYAEPFLSSGLYEDFGEVAAAGARALRRYGADTGSIRQLDGGYEIVVPTDGGESRFTIDDPDFSVRALRSTVVLRWELAPGSTLFAVWQQERRDLDSPARTASLGELSAPLSAPSVQTVALKLSYWLPVD